MPAHHRDSLTLVPHHLFNQAQLRPHSPSYYTHKEGKWVATSWEEYTQQIKKVACSLIKLGIQPQDRVCILGFNRPEWTISALATMKLLPNDNCVFIICIDTIVSVW